MIVEDKMTSHPRMEMMNDAFGCSRATHVHMEDQRLVNLTEIHPSQTGWMKMRVNNQTKIANDGKLTIAL